MSTTLIAFMLGFVASTSAVGPGSGSRIDPTGTWLRRQITTALATVPVLGEVESRTEATVLVVVERSEQGLIARSTVCALSNTTFGGLVTAEYSDAFRRIVSGHATRVIVRDHPTRGTMFWEPRIRRTLGLASSASTPSGASVPGDPSIPPEVSSASGPSSDSIAGPDVLGFTAFDEDEDGRPGVTVQIRGLVDGEVYVVQRSDSEARGSFRTPDFIEGRVRWRTAEQVIGANRDVLLDTPRIRPHPDPSKSWFTMTRVPDLTSCDQLASKVALDSRG